MIRASSYEKMSEKYRESNPAAFKTRFFPHHFLPAIFKNSTHRPQPHASKDRMLSCSSSSCSSSPSSSSSSSHRHHSFEPLISSPSSLYHPSSLRHFHSQQPPLVNPAVLPHCYHHLHHLQYTHPIIHSARHYNHLDAHSSCSCDSTHHLHPLSQAATTTDIYRSACAKLERISSHDPSRTDPAYCQAPAINSQLGNPVIYTSDDKKSSHNQSADPRCSTTTDCSPRSVIHHVQSSSSAASPDSSRPGFCHTHTGAKAAASPSSAFPGQATNLPIARLLHSKLRETDQMAVLLNEHDQSAIMDHQHSPTPWSVPTAAIHHRFHDASSNSTLPAHSGHINCEDGAEESSAGTARAGEMRIKTHQLFERGGSRSADLHWQRGIQQPKSGHVSGSSVEDKRCMTESDGGAGDGSLETAKEISAMANLQAKQLSFDANFKKCTAAKPVYNSTQIGYGHEVYAGRSFSCDLHSSKHGNSRYVCPCAVVQSQCDDRMKQLGSGFISPNQLDPPGINYTDGFANHIHSLIKDDRDARAQLGSKWEDADKWIRPANYYQHAPSHRGLIATNLGLLRMSNCINAGTAINSLHCIHNNHLHAPPPILDSHHYHNPIYSSNYADYTSQSSFTCSNSGGLSTLQESLINQPWLPNHHLADRLAAGQPMKEKWAKQRLGDDQNYHYMQGHCTEKLRAEGYGSSGAIGTRMASKLEWGSYKVPLNTKAFDTQSIKASINRETDRNSASLPQYHLVQHHHTDRLANGEDMSCATAKIFDSRHSGESLLTKATLMQESVVIPRVSLREVGTQISSVDGSGSISRLTSKSGSPQKPISPTRHNTPHMRSLMGSTNGINSLGGGGKQQALDFEELVESHRAKLELQALSEGERTRSFHRTTSNWSSREMEEADLSRSLRHSTELDDGNNNANNYPWPSHSYSWNKAEDSKLAKLQLKEARIKAWEEKQKTKADAQLKRLEESLEKKRSQTTNRIMGSLGVAQKKAEAMRASVYAEKMRSTKKSHRFRHRSLSPLSHCGCFSPM